MTFAPATGLDIRDGSAMLVLARTIDQSIMIGDDIKITVVDIRGNKVRLGITAPSDIPVHREEVFKEINEAKAQAQENV